MKSSERLKAMKELQKALSLENYKEVFKLKGDLEQIISDLNDAAYEMPRNPCKSSGMCACSGACMKPEAKMLLEKSEKISELRYKIF